MNIKSFYVSLLWLRFLLPVSWFKKMDARNYGFGELLGYPRGYNAWKPWKIHGVGKMKTDFPTNSLGIWGRSLNEIKGNDFVYLELTGS